VGGESIRAGEEEGEAVGLSLVCFATVIEGVEHSAKEREKKLRGCGEKKGIQGGLTAAG